MEASRELLFFFSALGAFNGLLLSFYFLFFAKPKHISNYFLGALLLTLSIRIGKSVFFYFNPELSAHFLQIGISACAFIGPSLYFYLKSMMTPEGEMKHTWKYHLMVLIPIVSIGGYLYPWESNYELWGCYFLPIVYYEWLIYIIASGFLIRPIFVKLFSKTEKLKSVEVWILSIFIGNFLIWLAYKTVAYTSYITGALSFSFILYLLVLFLFFNKKKESVLFKSKSPQKYGDKKIATSEAKSLISDLEKIMTQNELFKNPNLKLPDVAKKMNILPHTLSQLLNDNLGKNFSSFLNEYRIDAAKKMLLVNTHFSLEAIGYECGFNSKSTFYASFKKATGTTPAKFKEEFTNH